MKVIAIDIKIQLIYYAYDHNVSKYKALEYSYKNYFMAFSIFIFPMLI